ncbi:MAG: phage replisome organizer N-terminal domain-containing protein [Proteobacteria bacterium]|nr:phage replisome organizer N-terminal domain-containing protein [Pseudomonadota bacterium]MBU1060511.1 phage replisome organizer N-terminal domain-containing protein [Pseudomonadota bacterium]
MCNILDNRKIKMIRSGPEGNTLSLLWLLMLTEAGKCNRGGYLMIADNLPYTEETLNILTGIPLPTVRLGLLAFTELGMIDRKDGAIFIKNWRKYQSEDKLQARREKERLRQQRHRATVREKMKALPPPDEVSRDSHVSLSRDVTQENRQEQSRIDKTTTEQIRLLLSGTPLGKISEQDLEGLAKRHGPERLSQAADVAAEIWRRNPEDRHNPGGYLHSMCVSLVKPAWYVPFEQRTRRAAESQRRKKITQAEQSAMRRKQEENDAAMDSLWNSLSDQQCQEYQDKVGANLPKNIVVSEEIILVMAKSIAWQEAQACNHD